MDVPIAQTLLQQSRKHDEALLLVLVAKLLAVCPLLALGPDEHLDGTNGDEKRNRPVTASSDDAHPRQNLVHVVGAGDEREAVAVRDLALGAAS